MRHTALASIIVMLGAAMMPECGLTQQSADERTTVIEQAPKDHSIAIPTETLARHLKDMDTEQLQTLRLVEGGKYAVDLRRTLDKERDGIGLVVVERAEHLDVKSPTHDISLGLCRSAVRRYCTERLVSVTTVSDELAFLVPRHLITTV